ncbi:MAG: shikimate dehydrogenase [Ferruginibacter sp.]
MLKTYGIIGFPLQHSFSQKYFTGKFATEGITDCVYRNFPIPAIGKLPELLSLETSLIGLNVTIPYKKSVLGYLDRREKLPQGLDACNCIRIQNGELIGYNTDVIGFERSLLPLLQKQHTQALILGNGGAAEAVRFVLHKLGIPYRGVSRKLQAGTSLTYADLDESVIRSHTLIINTTPLGTFPEVETYPDIPYSFLSKNHLLYDLVYNPAKTVFLQKGEEAGAAIKNGYEMLLIQAEESWRIWNENQD